MRLQSRSQLVLLKLVQVSIALTAAMFAYVILYGSCLPESWLQEEVCSVIFMAGDFDVVMLAQMVIPMAQCIPFVMPVLGRGRFSSWTWSGPVTLIVIQTSKNTTSNDVLQVPF